MLLFGVAALASQPVPEACAHSAHQVAPGVPRRKPAPPSPVVGFVLADGAGLVGGALRRDPLPMPTDELLRHFAGLRAGADGQAWLAGGPVTVMLDGVSLGEMDLMSSDRRVTPRMEPPRSILLRLP